MSVVSHCTCRCHDEVAANSLAVQQRFGGMVIRLKLKLPVEVTDPIAAVFACTRCQHVHCAALTADHDALERRKEREQTPGWVDPSSKAA